MKKKSPIIEHLANKNVQQYLKEIEKELKLTHEEEVELAKRIKQGDKYALNKLVKAHLRFVVSVCKQYIDKGLSIGDLIYEGNLGLIKAAKRFDPTKGFNFFSYAIWWCRQSIMQAIADYSRMVRLPMNKCVLINKENKKKFELLSNKVEEYTKAIEDKFVSLDAPIGESSNLYDKIMYEEFTEKALIKESLKMDISKLLNNLTDRERVIIVKYFGLDGNPPLTLEEIGKIQNLTRERVRQIKEEVCKKLRNNSKYLKYYLDIL